MPETTNGAAAPSEEYAQPQPQPAAPRQPENNNNVDPETIQEIIALSVGNYVVVEFLVGTQNIVRKEGILTAVGMSWLVLYDESAGTSVVCDMYSVKFVTYFDPGARPARTGAPQSTQRQIRAQNRMGGYR